MPMLAGDIHFNNTRVSDFDKLIGLYGLSEFDSPYRSTIPLLALLRDGWPHFQQLLGACGLPDAPRLHLEWQVKPTKGKGKASHTDVMAIAHGAALAIEA